MIWEKLYYAIYFKFGCITYKMKRKKGYFGGIRTHISGLWVSGLLHGC